MKNFYYFLISFILLINLSSCSGYKSIFTSSNLEFKIAEHTLVGNKKLGNQIYSQLYNLFKSNKTENKTINIVIDTKKKRQPTVKNNTGKILEYKIILTTSIVFSDYLTKEIILNYNSNLSSSYKVQDQYSKTKSVENRNTDDLINRTFQDLLIQISQINTSK